MNVARRPPSRDPARSGITVRDRGGSGPHQRARASASQAGRCPPERLVEQPLAAPDPGRHRLDVGHPHGHAGRAQPSYVDLAVLLLVGDDQVGREGGDRPGCRGSWCPGPASPPGRRDGCTTPWRPRVRQASTLADGLGQGRHQRDDSERRAPGRRTPCPGRRHGRRRGRRGGRRRGWGHGPDASGAARGRSPPRPPTGGRPPSASMASAIASGTARSGARPCRRGRRRSPCRQATCRRASSTTKVAAWTALPRRSTRAPCARSSARRAAARRGRRSGARP